MFLNIEFIKFLVIGGINTVSTTVLALVFSAFIQENAAMVAAYLCSLTFAYFLNTFFVFKMPPALKRYGKFCVSYVPNFVITNTVFMLLFNILGLNRYAAIIFTACIGMPITFVCVKLFAFGKGNEKGK